MMLVTKFQVVSQRIPKGVFSFKIIEPRVFKDYFKPHEDLLVIIADQALMFVHFITGLNPSVTTSTHKIKYNFESYYLNYSPEKDEFDFYFVNEFNNMYKVHIYRENEIFISNSSFFFQLPIEIMSLDIIKMRRVRDSFLFVLYDSLKSFVYLSSVTCSYPFNIKSFFRFQISNFKTPFFFFATPSDTVIYVTGNDNTLLYQLVISENSTLKFQVDPSVNSNYRFLVEAKNDFYTKQIPIELKAKMSLANPRLIFHWIWLKIISNLVFVLLAIGLFMLFLFHFYIRKIISKKISGQSDQANAFQS